MHFRLIDRVVERSADRVVAVKQVSLAEEYLQDHFPDFPVLPGVMMVQALAEAGAMLVEERTGRERFVLGSVRGLKYGTFVRPGESLVVEVTHQKDGDEGEVHLKGVGKLVADGVDEPQTAVSGRFTMRPVRLNPQAGGTNIEAPE